MLVCGVVKKPCGFRVRERGRFCLEFEAAEGVAEGAELGFGSSVLGSRLVLLAGSAVLRRAVSAVGLAFGGGASVNFNYAF